jgi:Tol biopolymer transport system component
VKTHRLSNLYPLILLSLAIACLQNSQALTTIGRGRIMRVSVASDGSQADGAVWRSGFSADGRVVAFVSEATNLTGEPIAAGHPHLYAYDRATQQTTLLPIAPPGVPVDLATIGHDLAVSGDGRFVAFDSLTALVPDDTNDKADIYVHDRLTGETTRVSVASDGTQNNATSGGPRLSFDGRFVVFGSESNGLVPGYAGFGSFIHDRQSGTTETVTVATDGTPANMGGGGGSISDDGRLVAFISSSTNLDDDAVPGKANVFLRDRQTGETSWVWGPEGGAEIDSMDLSGDGRYLAISTRANCYFDVCDYVVHLYDRPAGRIVGHLDDVTVSQGSYQFLATASPVVAVLSDLPLVAEDSDGGHPDIYRHDFSTGETTLVSRPEFGPSVWFENPSHVAISADGRDIMFRSEGPYFVPGDTNQTSDVFLWTGDASFIYFPAVR